MEQHNHPSTKSTFQVGHNQFSDMTLDEYKQYNHLGEYSPGVLSPPLVLSSGGVSTTTTNMRMTSGTASASRKLQAGDVPSSIDWVELGAVPPVKNQGMFVGGEFFLLHIPLLGCRRFVVQVWFL
jgi:hypothetical protein